MVLDETVEPENIVTTQDSDHIRDWIEDHGGKPAIRRDNEGTDDLDILFADLDREESLEVIPWEEFFEIMTERDLAFAYIDSEEERIKTQKFEFQNSPKADIEMEESEIFDNTLETE